MQQDAGEVQSEDKNTLPDKNKKRRFKTPDQVEALEKFYNEHKYPSEELKAQFAVSVGLTEKQISGWFCHRRLKDKRLLSGEACANGKLDRSSGIIVPDHGSGYKQDSCGSTKEGGIRYFDLREVQSRGFTGSTKEGETHHFDHKEVQSRTFSGQNLCTDLKYENGRHDEKTSDEKTSDMEDTSSGSSLPLQNRLRCQDQDPANVAVSSYLPENEYSARTTKSLGYRPRPGPSGYLKLKTPAENPAIASVKRQMGRHYVEDGPPVSVEFDPLPPGAFESSINNPVDEPRYLGLPDLQRSPDVPRISSQPDFFKNRDIYNAETSPCHPQLDGFDLRAKHPSHGSGNYIGSVRNSVSSSRYKPFLNQNSSAKLDEEFYFDIPVHDRRSAKLDEEFSFEQPVCDRRSTKLDEEFSFELPVLDRRSYAQHDFYGRRNDDSINSGQTDSWPYKYDDVGLNKVQRRPLESKYSTAPVKRNEHFDMQSRGVSERISKKDQLVREGTAIAESSDSARVQGGKRAWQEFLEQRFRSRKASKVDPLLWTNRRERSAAADIPSSFSEDESAETSSSGD